MSAFAIATAVCGALVALGVPAILGFGIALHLVALAVGLAVGPALPHRRHWVRRPDAG